jgi:hypothetical protein
MGAPDIADVRQQPRMQPAGSERIRTGVLCRY